jgi:hypothetical protein
MAKNPKDKEQKIAQTVNAWEAVKPHKKFADMTVEEFRAKANRSVESRKKIKILQDQLEAEQAIRDDVDKDNLELVRRIVNDVLSDPEEGPDSELYKAMGYVRRSERKSGLTRKKKTPASS